MFSLMFQIRGLETGFDGGHCWFTERAICEWICCAHMCTCTYMCTYTHIHSVTLPPHTHTHSQTVHHQRHHGEAQATEMESLKKQIAYRDQFIEVSELSHHSLNTALQYVPLVVPSANVTNTLVLLKHSWSLGKCTVIAVCLLLVTCT